MDKSCPKCGSQIQEGAQFCTSCGESLAQAAVPTQPAPTQTAAAPPQPTQAAAAPPPPQPQPQFQQPPQGQPQQPQGQPQPQPYPQQQQQPYQQAPQQPYGQAPAPAPAKKSKTTMFIIIGAAVVLVALIAVMIGTKMFGLLGEKTTEQKKTEVTADAVIGTWKLESMEQDGEVLSWSEYLELLELFGVTDAVMDMAFAEDGTGWVNFMGEVITLTWESKGGGRYTLVDHTGIPFDVVLKDNKLIMDDDDGTILIFAKASSTASATPKPQTPTTPEVTVKPEYVTDLPYSVFGNDGAEFKGKYTGYVVDGKPEDTNGTFIYDDGSTYVGGWKDGVRSGQGTATWNNGAIYLGEWKDDQRNGQGTITWADGAKYVGAWENSNRSGQGTMTYSGGAVYVGEFKLDLRNGQGTTTWPNGDVYIGAYKDDRRSGQGIITYASGNKYDGAWANDMRNGQGTFTWPNGEMYVGDFVDDYRTGQGTYTWPSGSVYVGAWDGGEMAGQGTMTYANGDKYVGAWENGKREGQGILYNAAGAVLQQGQWEDGEFVG